MLRRLVKGGLQRIGLDLVRTRNDPKRTWLGLRCLPIRTVIDVGANTGQFAREARRVFPEARIYCFEPLAAPFAELERWARGEGDHVSVFNVALGESEGTIDMFLHADFSPSSSLLRSTETAATHYPFTRRQQPVPVRLTTLDSVCPALGGLSPDVLVKLDVQGYEDRVVRGGRAVLGAARSCIVEVNLDELYAGQARFEELLALFTSIGYRYAGNLDQAYANDGHAVYVDAVFRR